MDRHVLPHSPSGHLRPAAEQQRMPDLDLWLEAHALPALADQRPRRQRQRQRTAPLRLVAVAVAVAVAAAAVLASTELIRRTRVPGGRARQH